MVSSSGQLWLSNLRPALSRHAGTRWSAHHRREDASKVRIIYDLDKDLEENLSRKSHFSCFSVKKHWKGRRKRQTPKAEVVAFGV